MAFGLYDDVRSIAPLVFTKQLQPRNCRGILKRKERPSIIESAFNIAS